MLTKLNVLMKHAALSVPPTLNVGVTSLSKCLSKNNLLKRLEKICKVEQYCGK